MVTIKADVVGNLVIIRQAPVIASGAEGTNEIEFEFNSDWTGFSTKTAVFQNTLCVGVYDATIDATTNKVTIPDEVLANPGMFKFGVYGSNTGGDIMSTNLVDFGISKGAYDLVNSVSNDALPAFYDHGVGAQLTKPCPLMPDGHWEKATTQFGWDPEQQKVWYNTTTTSNSIFVRFNGSVHFNSGKQYFDTVPTNGWYVGATRTGSWSTPGKGLAECRMYFPTIHSSWSDSTVGTQGSKGWLIYRSGSTICDLYIISSSVKTVMDIFTNYTSLTEDTLLMECVVCAYVYDVDA